MNTLRWILVSATGVVLVSFIVLISMAGDFRRSFGASENGPLVTLLPVTVMLVFLSGLLFPGQRVLLHVAAALAVALGVWAGWVCRESAFIGVSGLLYSVLYLIWYWQAAWARAGLSSH